MKNALTLLMLVFLAACGESAQDSPQADSQAQVAGPQSASPLASAAEETLQVYKSPTCGCCGAWIEHLNGAGLTTGIVHPPQMAQIKAEAGVPAAMQSCHTAISKDGYVFEGHVPASAIQDFLAEPPVDALGLAVPGMPMGSPGMEVGGRFDAYTVYLLKNNGAREPWRNYQQYEDQF